MYYISKNKTKSYWIPYPPTHVTIFFIHIKLYSFVMLLKCREGLLFPIFSYYATLCTRQLLPKTGKKRTRKQARKIGRMLKVDIIKMQMMTPVKSSQIWIFHCVRLWGEFVMAYGLSSGSKIIIIIEMSFLRLKLNSLLSFVGDPPKRVIARYLDAWEKENSIRLKIYRNSANLDLVSNHYVLYFCLHWNKLSGLFIIDRS